MRLDQSILNLLMGYSGGPFGLHLEASEKAVLRAIRYQRGLNNAISIAEVQKITDLDPRTIKESVRTLRMSFHIPIGSSKHSTRGGYFLMVTDADRAVWRRDVTDQIRAEVEVLRAADGHLGALEVLGQLQLELRRNAGEAR
jgi:hypothetical protein